MPWMQSMGQNFQPFTGNDEVSISVKNSRVRRKTPIKQKNSAIFSRYSQKFGIILRFSKHRLIFVNFSLEDKINKTNPVQYVL